MSTDTKTATLDPAAVRDETIRQAKRHFRAAKKGAENALQEAQAAAWMEYSKSSVNGSK